MQPSSAPQAFTQRLCGILAADAVGYSRLMAEDESTAIAALDSARAVFAKAVLDNRGRVVDMAGDSVLALFNSAYDALSSAVVAQDAIETSPETSTGPGKLRFRVGLHLGDVLERADGSAYGDGINVAARIQSIAHAGGIALSESIALAVRGRGTIQLTDLGHRELKNIAHPVHVYHVNAPGRPLAGKILGSGAARENDGERPTLTVLPFKNLSAGTDQEYFAEGITDAIVADLSRVRWISVTAETSPAIAQARESTSNQYARYALSGTVQRSSDRVRIVTRLTNSKTGVQVWGERYDRPLSDIFALQDEIVRTVCSGVGISLSEAEIARARGKPTGNLGAWDHYLLALPPLRMMTAEGFVLGVQHLVAALELDPSYADAHARLAVAYLRAAHFRWGDCKSGESIAHARRHAESALALDPSNALALDALGSVHLYVGNPEAAAATARRAIDIDPSLTSAHGTLINALAFAGLASEALEAYERCNVVSLRDPDRSGVLMGHVNALFVARRFEEVVDAARQHAETRPNWYGSHVMLAVGLAKLGLLAQARQEAGEVMRLVPRFSLKGARTRPHFKRPEDVETFLDGLRLAGIPE